MSQHLTGHRLVLTRPAGQGARLAALLRDQGAEVLQFPVTAIAPLADTAPLAALALRLGEFSLAFFVSANAVEQCFAVIDRESWPASLQVATVGPATARSLREQGFAEVIVPPERFDSEGVLALPAFSAEAVAGHKVLVLRGDGGRELLAEHLRERGAEVEQHACYRRLCAALDPAPLLDPAAPISGIVFSNGEAVGHFLQILGEAGAELLAQLPVFAPHPRILERARAAGACQTALTEAGDEGIVAGILKYLGQGHLP